MEKHRELRQHDFADPSLKDVSKPSLPPQNDHYLVAAAGMPACGAGLRLPNENDFDVKRNVSSARQICENIIESLLSDITHSAMHAKGYNAGAASEVKLCQDDHPDLYGACKSFATMSTSELALVLGRSTLPSAREGIRSLHTHTDFMPLRNGNLDVFPAPDTSTISFPRSEILSQWIYQGEDGRFLQVPFTSTKWIITWLFGKGLIPPAFAPVRDWQTVEVQYGGRTRLSKKTKFVMSLCSGEFRTSADIFKSFRCSLFTNGIHACPSQLYVVLCSSHLADKKRDTVEVQCVWATGCTHHKDEIIYGRTRKEFQGLELAKTPHGVCLEYAKKADPLALAAGNRSFGYTKTETARRAQHVSIKSNYKRGTTDLHSICLAMKELADTDMKMDPSGSLPFFGGIHDLQATNTGEIDAVSVYHALSTKIVAEEVINNPRATAVIDTTGNIVADVAISTSSDVARRSKSGNRKEPRRETSDNRVIFEVLNFHLVFPLPTGPFVACESLVVGKTANTFHGILLGFRRSLAYFGPNAEHIKHFVSDMAVPFAIAVVKVFNDLHLLEYMAILALAAKRNDDSIRSRNIKTRLVWCDVHGDRAMKEYGRKAFKNGSPSLQLEMMVFFRNIRMLLVSVKSYEELCMAVAFLCRFSSLKVLQAVPQNGESRNQLVVDSKALQKEGEEIIWRHLGGVPKIQDTVSSVKIKACLSKGYNSASFEELVLTHESHQSLAEAENSFDRATMEDFKAPRAVDNAQLLDVIVESAAKGVFKYSFGPFDVYVVFRERNETQSRYRVYVPFMSLVTGSIGGFNIWCDFLNNGNTISNVLFMDGRATTYLKRQWISNLTLYCPLITGEMPITHNTAVEVSEKIKKHHEDLGSDAFTRSGGMDIAEYVKKAGLCAKAEGRRVIENLRSFYRKKRSERNKAKEGKQLKPK